jgi:general secretion pathway protein H
MPAKASAGFTLIEMIVVLIIVGVIMGMVSLSRPGDGSVDRLRRETRRLQALIQLAREEAILTHREIGLRQEAQGYQFLVFSGENWQSQPLQDTPLRQRRLPEDIRLTLRLEEQGGKEEAGQGLPQLVFWSSGEATAFRAEFRLRSGQSYKLKGDAIGETVLGPAAF